MIRYISLSLLVLIPTVLSQVPTGCVQIKNRYLDKFLVNSTSYDAERRHVSYDKTPEKWVIRSEGANYRITHALLKEELYESAKTSNGNYVFLWIPRETSRGKGWNITKADEGYFTIKSVKFGHCLYTKGWLGWIGAYEECTGDKYQWKIISTTC